MVDRFFIDALVTGGELFLIPPSKRDEWHDFDCRSEQTHEILPVPAWAKPVDVLGHIEFEAPVDVFADHLSDDAAKSTVEGDARFSRDWWNA